MKRNLLRMASLVLLGGCTTAGPDYQGPPVILPGLETAEFSNDLGLPDLPVRSQWWSAFEDSALDEIVAQVGVRAPDMKIMRARMAAADAELRISRERSRPALGLEASYQRTRPALAAFGIDDQGFEVSDTDLFDTGIEASWEIDTGGRRIREREQFGALFGAALAGAEDMHVSLIRRTVDAYLRLRFAQADLELLQEMRNEQEALVSIARASEQLGGLTMIDVEAERAPLVDTTIEMSERSSEVNAARAELAALLGTRLMDLPGFIPGQSSELSVPRFDGLSKPVDLLHQRPDVRRAERLLAARSAEIGIAASDYYPAISLTGTAGLIASDPARLASDGFTYAIGPRLNWSFTNRDLVGARVDRARARFNEARAIYENAVVEALAEAETALGAYHEAGVQAEVRSAALLSARNVLDLIEVGRRLGTVTEADVRRGRIEVLERRRAVLESRVEAGRAYAALSTRLGLGWTPQSPSQTAAGTVGEDPK